jgi:hypothetical protein
MTATRTDTPAQAGAPNAASRIRSLLSIGEESLAQLRLPHGLDNALVHLRSIEEAVIEFEGSVYLPKGCSVVLDLQVLPDPTKGRADGEPSMILKGVVSRVEMISTYPSYAIRITTEREAAQALDHLRRALAD